MALLELFTSYHISVPRIAPQIQACSCPCGGDGADVLVPGS